MPSESEPTGAEILARAGVTPIAGVLMEVERRADQLLRSRQPTPRPWLRYVSRDQLLDQAAAAVELIVTMDGSLPGANVECVLCGHETNVHRFSNGRALCANCPSGLCDEKSQTRRAGVGRN